MKKNNSDHNTNELLVFTYKNRKPLFFTGVAAGIVSIIISLLLPVLYESSAIVFPTATSTVSFNAQSNVKAGAMDFGEEENAEQLIQILESGPMRNRIVEEFDLGAVYELKPDEKNYYYKLKKKYEKHIKFKRTKYGSINISVLDKSPELAAEITNKIVDLIDTLKNDLIKERTIPAFEINQRKIDQLNNELNELNKELDSLAKLGVIESRSRVGLIEAYNTAKSEASREYFLKKIEANQVYGAKYDALVELREFRIEKLTDQEVSYEQAESDATEIINQKFVIERAYPSDKKEKPKRAIIVLISTISTVIMMFVVLLIRERIRELKLEE